MNMWYHQDFSETNENFECLYAWTPEKETFEICALQKPGEILPRLKINPILKKTQIQLEKMETPKTVRSKPSWKP